MKDLKIVTGQHAACIMYDMRRVKIVDFWGMKPCSLVVVIDTPEELPCSPSGCMSYHDM